MNTQFKMCSMCKSMIPLSTKGQYCSKCQSQRYKEKSEYRNKNRPDIQKVYNKSRYRKAKAECMKNANGLCEVCYHYGIKKLAGKTHHIVKVADGNDNTHYNVNNLVAVCSECHKKIEGLSREQLINILSNNIRL